MKHPVIKQKKATSRGKKQYHVFAETARKKLLSMVPLVDCPHCKQKKINHFVCPNCGYYGNKEVRKTSIAEEKITKIKV